MSLLGELTYALISAPRSSFGGIFPDVIVEEVYRDALVITDHPVEHGAAITDHAFLRPRILEMRCGFSNSTAGTEGYIDAVYEAMLQLQSIREPFDVFTPRRAYTNMLLADLQVTRDSKTNSVLACSVALREVILTETQSTSTRSGDQAMPQKTASAPDLGARQVAPQASYPPGGA